MSESYDPWADPDEGDIEELRRKLAAAEERAAAR